MLYNKRRLVALVKRWEASNMKWKVYNLCNAVNDDIAMHVIVSLKRMLSVEKQTLDIFAICAMLCMLLHVYWGVQVYANEIITIHSALSNVPKASFQVLFYNLRAAAMWQKVIEIVKCKRNTSKMKETEKERTNFWISDTKWMVRVCKKCIVRILWCCSGSRSWTTYTNMCSHN